MPKEFTYLKFYVKKLETNYIIKDTNFPMFFDSFTISLSISAQISEVLQQRENYRLVIRVVAK